MLIIVGVNPGAALVFAGIIMIALAGLTLDTCLRGLLLLADPSLGRATCRRIGSSLRKFFLPKKGLFGRKFAQAFGKQPEAG